MTPSLAFLALAMLTGGVAAEEPGQDVLSLATAYLEAVQMAVVQTRVRFDAKDGETWLAVERQQVWVFEFEGSRIKRIIEYW